MDKKIADLKARIDNDFTYHRPPQEAIDKLGQIRTKARELAHLVADTVPFGREQASALTNLEQVMFHSNAGITRPFPIEQLETKVVLVTCSIDNANLTDDLRVDFMCKREGKGDWFLVPKTIAVFGSTEDFIKAKIEEYFKCPITLLEVNPNGSQA